MVIQQQEGCRKGREAVAKVLGLDIGSLKQWLYTSQTSSSKHRAAKRALKTWLTHAQDADGKGETVAQNEAVSNVLDILLQLTHQYKSQNKVKAWMLRKTTRSPTPNAKHQDNTLPDNTRNVSPAAAQKLSIGLPPVYAPQQTRLRGSSLSSMVSVNSEHSAASVPCSTTSAPNKLHHVQTAHGSIHSKGKLLNVRDLKAGGGMSVRVKHGADNARGDMCFGSPLSTSTVNRGGSVVRVCARGTKVPVALTHRSIQGSNSARKNKTTAQVHQVNTHTTSAATTNASAAAVSRPGSSLIPQKAGSHKPTTQTQGMQKLPLTNHQQPQHVQAGTGVLVPSLAPTNVFTEKSPRTADSQCDAPEQGRNSSYPNESARKEQQQQQLQQCQASSQALAAVNHNTQPCVNTINPSSINPVPITSAPTTPPACAKVSTPVPAKATKHQVKAQPTKNQQVPGQGPARKPRAKPQVTTTRPAVARKVAQLSEQDTCPVPAQSTVAGAKRTNVTKRVSAANARKPPGRQVSGSVAGRRGGKPVLCGQKQGMKAGGLGSGGDKVDGGIVGGEGPQRAGGNATRAAEAAKRAGQVGKGGGGAQSNFDESKGSLSLVIELQRDVAQGAGGAGSESSGSIMLPGLPGGAQNQRGATSTQSCGDNDDQKSDLLDLMNCVQQYVHSQQAADGGMQPPPASSYLLTSDSEAKSKQLSDTYAAGGVDNVLVMTFDRDGEVEWAHEQVHTSSDTSDGRGQHWKHSSSGSGYETDPSSLISNKSRTADVAPCTPRQQPPAPTPPSSPIISSPDAKQPTNTSGADTQEHAHRDRVHTPEGSTGSCSMHSDSPSFPAKPLKYPVTARQSTHPVAIHSIRSLKSQLQQLIDECSEDEDADSSDNDNVNQSGELEAGDAVGACVAYVQDTSGGTLGGAGGDEAVCGMEAPSVNAVGVVKNECEEQSKDEYEQSKVEYEEQGVSVMAVQHPVGIEQLKSASPAVGSVDTPAVPRPAAQAQPAKVAAQPKHARGSWRDTCGTESSANTDQSHEHARNARQLEDKRWLHGRRPQSRARSVERSGMSWHKHRWSRMFKRERCSGELEQQQETVQRFTEQSTGTVNTSTGGVAQISVQHTSSVHVQQSTGHLSGGFTNTGSSWSMATGCAGLVSQQGSQNVSLATIPTLHEHGAASGAHGKDAWGVQTPNPLNAPLGLQTDCSMLDTDWAEARAHDVPGHYFVEHNVRGVHHTARRHRSLTPHHGNYHEQWYTHHEHAGPPADHQARDWHAHHAFSTAPHHNQIEHAMWGTQQHFGAAHVHASPAQNAPQYHVPPYAAPGHVQQHHHVQRTTWATQYRQPATCRQQIQTNAALQWNVVQGPVPVHQFTAASLDTPMQHVHFQQQVHPQPVHTTYTPHHEAVEHVLPVPGQMVSPVVPKDALQAPAAMPVQNVQREAALTTTNRHINDMLHSNHAPQNGATSIHAWLACADVTVSKGGVQCDPMINGQKMTACKPGKRPGLKTISVASPT